MNRRQRLMIVALLTLVPSLTTRAHSQGVADPAAAGLSPQGASLSPDFSVSLAADGGLGQGRIGGGAKRLTSKSPLASSGGGTRGGVASQTMASKLAAYGGSSSAPPTATALSVGGQSLPVSSFPAIPSLSSPRPFMGMSGGFSRYTSARAPRNAPAAKSSSVRPLYSFMIRHETGKISSSPRGASMKGRSRGRSRSAVIEQAMGGTRSH
jgi:hypothetical protein